MKFVLCGVALLALVGCSDDDATTATTTTTAVDTTTAAPSTASTVVDDGPAPAPVDDHCTVLAAALGGAFAPEQFAPAGPQGCTFTDQAAARAITFTIEEDVDSSTYEEALAAPTFGDPLTVPELGETAAVADDGGGVRLLVFAERRLLSFDAIGYSVDELEGVARGALVAL